MYSILYLFMAFTMYAICYIKSRDLLHPIGIGSLLWFLFSSLSSYSGFFDTSLQVPLSGKTQLCIALSGIMFFIPALFSSRMNKKYVTVSKIEYTFSYRIIFNTILVLTVFAFLARFGAILFSPPILSGGVSDIKSTVPVALPVINYADLFMPFAAIACYMEIRFSDKLTRNRAWVLYGYIVFSVIVALAYKVSRGDFLVFSLGFVYIYLSTKRISVSIKNVVIVTSLLALFIGMGIYRISDQSRVSTQFGDGVLNVVFSQVYTYIAMNYQNLNMLINARDVEPTIFWGSVKFFLSPFFNSSYENNTLGLVEYTTLFFNAKTYLYYFFLDLGIAGVVIYPLIIGLIIQHLYNLATTRVKYFLLLSFLMKGLFFMAFGNYFFGELVALFPYLLGLILVLAIKSKINNNLERYNSMMRARSQTY